MRAETAPRVLVIDIGGVIARDPRPKVVRTISRAEGLDPARFARSYYRVCRHHATAPLGVRKMYEALRRAHHLSMRYRAFHHLVADETLVVYPQVLRALRELKREGGVKVVLASNIERHVWSGLDRKFGLRRVADRAVLSFRAGVLKPNPSFYRKLLRREQVDPSDALYLDDLRANVLAARRLGMRAKVVHSPAETARVVRGLRRAHQRAVRPPSPREPLRGRSVRVSVPALPSDRSG